MQVNKTIDHTLLKANATREQIQKLCEEAKQYNFASVCVNTYWIPFCKSLLHDSDVNICCVVGFPLGAMATAAKAFEAQYAIEQGADEIDMVMNIGELKAQNYDAVYKDIKSVVDAAQGRCVKVILETCLLTKEEIIKACEICVEAKAHFVKTSTGFSTHGATIEDVALMKQTVQDRCKVKAAGGVRNADDLQNMLNAGADRIGTSAGVSLMQGKQHSSDY